MPQSRLVSASVRSLHFDGEKPFRSETRPEPERLYGTASAETFLRRHLLSPPRKYAEVPVQNSLLLYGRKGAGKSTLLHKLENGKRVFTSSFDHVVGWKLRPWDKIEAFDTFVGDTIARADLVHDAYAVAKHSEGEAEYYKSKVKRERMIIVIFNIHHLATTRDQTCMFQLARLLSALRIQAGNVTNAKGNGAVKIVMTSDLPPSQLPQELKCMIDAEQYVGNIEAHERRGFLLEHMRRFQSLATREPEFEKLGWAVPLDENSVQDDPDHIVNQLTVASHGCTPWEMKCFLERVNLACSSPKEDGATEYSADLIASMLCKTSGVGRTLTEHNPATLNMPFSRYLGTSFTTVAEFDAMKTQRVPLPGEAALDAPFLTAEEREKKKRTLEERDAEMSESLAQLAARAEDDANREARKRQREDAFSRK